MRRSAVSASLNLAEGAGRRSGKDKANRFTIARGECSEAAAAVEVAMTMKLVQRPVAEAALELAEREYAMLTGLIKHCSG